MSNDARLYNYSVISIYNIILKKLSLYRFILCFNSDFRNTTKQR
jgi:hypothetical protein